MSSVHTDPPNGKQEHAHWQANGADYPESATLAAALYYYDHGCSVVPCCVMTEQGECLFPHKHDTEKSIGKVPIIGQNWPDARLTREQIELWLKRYPNANVGVLLEPSELLIIDVDSKEAELEAARRGLPPGPQVKTGGGVHHYYRNLKGIVGATTRQGDSGKIDILSQGIIITHGSRHRSGVLYQQLVSFEEWPLEDPPRWAEEWLLASIKAKAEVEALPEDLKPITVSSLILPTWVKELIVTGKTLSPSDYPSRSEALYAVIMQLIRAGYDTETIASILLAPSNRISEKPREQGRRWLASDIARARAKQQEQQEQKKEAPTEGEERTQQALPRIIVSNEHLRNVVDNSLEALKQKNSPPSLFVRAGQLARVQFDERFHPMIVPMKDAALRERLSRDADFYRLTKKKEEWIETKVSPPKDTVESILTLPEWPFPALHGVVECPILRPNGTILDTPGYDPVTHLYYAPTPGLVVPKVSEYPTAEDVHKSLGVIGELLCDFKFVNPADKTNAYASLFTPVARPAILGNVPLALFDKPTPGTGATYLADNIATIATGVEAPKQMIPEGRGSEEEWKKKILSILLRGAPVVVFDNVSELASDSLSSLLTTQWWQDRLLGSNTQIRLPVRVTWIATANNIALRGDLPRRCYRVRLDARMERPSQRADFKHPNLLDWTLKNRGELLAAILTLSRAWFSAGEPRAKVPQLAGYGEWTRVIGGILAHAEVKGFLENLNELYDLVDDEGTQWATFLKVWFDQFQDKPKLISDFCGVLITSTPLVETIPESITWDPEKLDVFKKKLGHAFKKRIDRIYGGYRLERLKKDPHAKTALWRVVEVRGSAGSGFTPSQDEKTDGNKKNGVEGDCKQTRETPRTPQPSACDDQGFDWRTGE